MKIEKSPRWRRIKIPKMLKTTFIFEIDEVMLAVGGVAKTFGAATR